MKKVLLMLIVSSMMVFSFPAKSDAVVSYFGGTFAGSFFCPCSANLLVFINDYVSGSVIPMFYGAGSNLLVGSPLGLYQTGSYGGASVCAVPCHSGCCVIMTGPIIGFGSPGYGTSN